MSVKLYAYENDRFCDRNGGVDQQDVVKFRGEIKGDILDNGECKIDVKDLFKADDSVYGTYFFIIVLNYESLEDFFVTSLLLSALNNSVDVKDMGVKIALYIPYIPYQSQNEKDEKNKPNSQEVVRDLFFNPITTKMNQFSCDKVVTLDSSYYRDITGSLFHKSIHDRFQYIGIEKLLVISGLFEKLTTGEVFLTCVNDRLAKTVKSIAQFYGISVYLNNYGQYYYFIIHDVNDDTEELISFIEKAKERNKRNLFYLYLSNLVFSKSIKRLLGYVEEIYCINNISGMIDRKIKVLMTEEEFIEKTINVK